MENEEVTLDLLDPKTTRTGKYTQDYKDAVFYTWYKRGKCTGNTLRGYIEPDVEGNIPHQAILVKWIKEDFQNRAIKLDEIVTLEMDNKVVAEKVEMLQRHAKLGTDMQDMAMVYLIDHPEELKPANAIKLLVDGIKTERESRGLPTIITETLNASDEALFESISKLMGKDEMGFEDEE